MDRSILGELHPDGTIAVTQSYVHFPLSGTCPLCLVQWEGTMRRFPETGCP